VLILYAHRGEFPERKREEGPQGEFIAICCGISYTTKKLSDINRGLLLTRDHSGGYWEEKIKRRHKKGLGSTGDSIDSASFVREWGGGKVIRLLVRK